jgi:hypothetical protein
MIAYHDTADEGMTRASQQDRKAHQQQLDEILSQAFHHTWTVMNRARVLL